MILDELLTPIVAALAATELGVPKTQMVIGQHIGSFEAILEHGLTYKQIAEGLNVRGARGRTGAEFTGQSLYNFIKRAKGKKDRPPGAATRGPSVRPTDVGGPSPASTAKNQPTSPELERFKHCIDQARIHNAIDDLFRRGKR
jgi:hypothetical protein